MSATVRDPRVCVSPPPHTLVLSCGPWSGLSLPLSVTENALRKPTVPTRLSAPAAPPPKGLGPHSTFHLRLCPWYRRFPEGHWRLGTEQQGARGLRGPHPSQKPRPPERSGCLTAGPSSASSGGRRKKSDLESVRMEKRNPDQRTGLTHGLCWGHKTATQPVAVEVSSSQASDMRAPVGVDGRSGSRGGSSWRPLGDRSHAPPLPCPFG